MTLEETLLQESIFMVSRMQEVMDIIKGSQGRMNLEIHQGNLHPPSAKVCFLVIAILVQTLGIWQRIVGHTTWKNIMVPISSLEEIFQKEVMIPHS